MKRALLCVACLVALSAASPVPADVRLTLEPYFRDLRVIQLKAGARSLTMLVDTGGGVTAISPEIAASIGCTPHGTDVGHRMTGEAVTFQRCASVTLATGAWSHTFSPVAVFDVGALLPKELPHVDGVLSLDAFRGRVVTLDWAANAITVVDRSRERQAIAASGWPTRIATGETGRFFTVFVAIASTAGLRDPLWFLLDSGNIRGTLVAESVVRDKLLPLTATGDASLAIGSRPPVATPFTATALAIDGALGTDTLKRGPVTLDLR
jgi:hypothetical protein